MRAADEGQTRGRADFAAWSIIVAFAVFCLYGAFGPWQWGHNGFNGAAFAQGARNAIRFGTHGQALYYTGLTPPGADTIYTHHPQLLHWHLIGLFRLLGMQPWVGRLIPAFYSVATLVLVHRIGVVLWDRRFALIATALYATVPLHTIFANMIDHEQGAIFWLLLTTYGYVRWLSDHSPKRLLGVLVTISLAAQFDWPAYYVAFFIAVHALFRGLGAGGPLGRWRPEWTFLVVFSAVVLANFGGFFLWVHLVRGTLSEMAHAYTLRTNEIQGYFRQFVSRALDMNGPVPLGLTLAWLPLIAVRWRRCELRDRDIIPAFFLAAQAIHSTVFKNAGFIHSYWTYYLGAATAFGGAEVVSAFIDKGLAFARDRKGLQLVVVAVLSVTAAHLAVMSYLRLRWAFSMGTGSYFIPYPDQHAHIRFSQWLGRTFRREDTRYFIHPSMPVRIEFHWYHDTPFEERGELVVTAADLGSNKRLIMLVDTARNGARGSLARLLRTHPAWVFDRRFVAVDLSGKGPKLESYRSSPVPIAGAARVFRRWFVDPLHAPLEYVRDDDQAAAEALDYPELSYEAELSTRSGSRTEWDCPKGKTIVGFEGAPTDAAPSSPTTLARIRFTCGGGERASSPGFGGKTGKSDQTVDCPTGQVAVGLEARFGRFVDAAALLCAPVVNPLAGVPTVDSSAAAPTAFVGGSGGAARRLVCPDRQVMRGIRVRAGALVDSLGIACGNL